MIGACPFVPSIYSIAAPSVHPRLAKPYSFHSFTGAKLPKAVPCLEAMTCRVETLKDAMEREIGTDTAGDVAEVNELQDLELKPVGDEDEVKKEALDSQGEVFVKTMKKANDAEVDNYDRFKMNNGKEVSLAQMEYQLPRLTKMWAHLERQAGGKVKGMGEKQIEVDKRILRTQIGILKKELESVRKHRKLYRIRRLSVPIPVVSLVGYTNAGKSTLLNCLTGADVLTEDRLFATLDPTTRKVQMSNGKQFLLTDTVGFIQKLPTMLVAAFRATLEEISESSLLVHVVDISHPLAQLQIDAVNKVLQELDVVSIPNIVVWNKVDKTDDPQKVKHEAEKKGIICISAITGDGLKEFCDVVQAKLRDSMVLVEAFIPYGQGDLLNTIHHVGMVEEIEYMENGTRVLAYVPLPLARSLTPLRQQEAAAL